MRTEQPVLMICVMAATYLYGPADTVAKDMTSREFLSDYEPAAQRLEAFYTTVRISATTKRSNWAAYKDTGGEQADELTFAASGSNSRLDTTPIRQRNEGTRRKARGIVTTPSRCFSVSKELGKEDYVLDNLGTEDRAWQGRIRMSSPLVTAPYGFLEERVVDFLKDPDVRITRVEQVDGNGKHLVRVSYMFDVSYVNEDNEKIETYKYGWLVFAPSESWALRKWWHGDGPWNEAGTQTGTLGVIEYSGMKNGIPLLRRVEKWTQYRKKKGERHNIETIDIVNIQPGPVPEEEFSPEAYGIHLVSARRSPILIVSIVAGIVIFVFVAILAWRSRGEASTAA